MSKEKKTCGAKTKRKGTPCTHAAGFKTDHLGQGKCYLHGGATPIKHGRYSKVTRVAIREAIERFEEDPDPLDLLPEVAVLRATLEDFINRFDEVFGPDGALLAWHESFQKGENPKPLRVIPDFAYIAKLAGEVGAMVDRVQRHKQTASISMATLNRVVEQLGAEVVNAVRELKIAPELSEQILEAVERRWDSIRLESGSAGGAGAARGEG